MKVLVACEYSGIVREAFNRKGHDAWSCDLLASEDGGKHIQEDALEVIKDDWDMVIAHPPCTHLSGSGAAHWEKKRQDGRQQEAERFFMSFIGCAPRVAIENPVGRMSTVHRPPDQIIHPYYFGDPVMKKTCLWLENLPFLMVTIYNEPEMVRMKNGERMSKWHYDTFRLPPNVRGKERSRFFPGIAEAMSDQWG